MPSEAITQAVERVDSALAAISGEDIDGETGNLDEEGLITQLCLLFQVPRDDEHASALLAIVTSALTAAAIDAPKSAVSMAAVLYVVGLRTGDKLGYGRAMQEMGVLGG